MLTFVVISLAAFAGGVLNAAAGGGTFFTLSALLFIGVSPVSANTTGTVALLPGYIASTLGFREDFKEHQDTNLVRILMISVLGGATGASPLLVTSDDGFRQLIPWLMLLSTLWFALWPFVQARMRREGMAGPMVTTIGLFLVTVYGGYFNGGLGIILLALCNALGYSSLNFINGLKNAVSAVLTVIAVIVYTMGGTVEWGYALSMMAAAIIGGYVGARWSRLIPDRILRFGIVLVGAIMTTVFFIW